MGKAFTYWHPAGVLLEKYGHRAVYDAQSRLEARLSTVLINGVWCQRPARSDALVEIQGRLPEIKIGDCDTPIWSASKKGSYVSSDTWEILRRSSGDRRSLYGFLLCYPQAYFA